MSNRTYVCIPCRTAARAPSSFGKKTDYRCRLCQGEVYEVSHKWRIPKQNDDKQWAILHKKVVEDQNFYREYHRKNALQQLEQVDRQLETVTRQKKDTEAKLNKLQMLRAKKQRIIRQNRGLIDDYEPNQGEQSVPPKSDRAGG